MSLGALSVFLVRVLAFAFVCACCASFCVGAVQGWRACRVVVELCFVLGRSVGRLPRSLDSPQLVWVVSLVLGGFLWPCIGAGAVRDARLFILRLPL